jgi:hypothetical protein
MQQAQQDSLVFTGFLNHFKWNESGNSAFVFLSIGVQDQQGQTQYQSIPMTVTKKPAQMLEKHFGLVQAGKQSGQRHSVLVQVYSGRIGSYAPMVNNQEQFPIVQITAFRALVISADAAKNVIDDSENYGQQQQGGFAPQQQAPQQQAPHQQAPHQQAPHQQAPQQQAPQQQAPQQQAPQQQGGFAPQQQAPQQQGGFAPQQQAPQQQGGFAPQQQAPQQQGSGFPQESNIVMDDDDDIPF